MFKKLRNFTESRLGELLIVGAIFALALYLRLFFVNNINHLPLKDYSADAFNYDVMVRQFLDKGFLGYLSAKPNAYITPGYPLFLAAIYKAVGYQPESPLQTVRLIQAIIAAVTVPLMYLVGKAVKNVRVGILAALLAAVYPPFVWAPTILLTETLGTFFLVLYLYTQLTALSKEKPLYHLINGVVFGLGLLVRPATAPVIIFPYLIYWWRTRDLCSTIKGLAWTVGGVIIIMLPWWVRNVLTMHKLIFLATQTWNPMLGGAFPYFEGMYPLPKVESTTDVLKFILQGFLKQPALYLKWFTIGKFNIIFERMWFDLAPKYPYLRNLVLIHPLIVSVGWLGVLSALRHREIQIPAILAFLMTGIQLMFIPVNRYAFGIMPMLMVTTAFVAEVLLFGDASSPQPAARG
ncbi:MAG: glycosyltransferase family 39 protein [Bacillota bacterium]